MWVQSLDGEDPLEEGMATHSSILAWRIPGMEEPGRLQSTGLHRGVSGLRAGASQLEPVLQNLPTLLQIPPLHLILPKVQR